MEICKPEFLVTQSLVVVPIFLFRFLHCPSRQVSAVSMEVPTASSLRDIYPEDAIPAETKRWDSLLAKFKDLYGKQADFVARSPGRVNIIGEVNALGTHRMIHDLYRIAH